jgi:hypothetical protein
MMLRSDPNWRGWKRATLVVDIPNGYTSDVVSYQQTRVAHGGGMADSQPDGLVTGGMADCRLPCHGRFHAAMPWRIPCRHELMADSQTAGAYGRFNAAIPWWITGRRSLWRIRRQAHGRLPCSTRIGLSLGLHIVSAPEPP